LGVPKKEESPGSICRGRVHNYNELSLGGSDTEGETHRKGVGRSRDGVIGRGLSYPNADYVKNKKKKKISKKIKDEK